MPTPVVYPQAMSFAGLAKETTQGTAVVPARFIPYSPGSLDTSEQPEVLVDEGERGSMAREYGAVRGKNRVETGWNGVPFSEPMGDLLLNVLGHCATTGAGPYTHTLSLLNNAQGQPPSMTVTDRQGITASTGARTYPGYCISELTLSGNAEQLLTYEVKGTGWGSAAAGASPTNAPVTSTVTPAWRSSVSWGGTAVTSVMEWSLTLARELMVINTADGTQNPFVIARGPLTVNGNLNIVASDQTPLNAEVPLTNLVAGTEAALVIAVAANYAGTAGHSITFTMTKTQLVSAPQQRSQTVIGWNVGFQCFANDTDDGTTGGLSPVKATLVNGVATY
jgi:Tfp pilus assembly protein PilX